MPAASRPDSDLPEQLRISGLFSSSMESRFSDTGELRFKRFFNFQYQEHKP